MEVLYIKLELDHYRPYKKTSDSISKNPVCFKTKSNKDNSNKERL